MDKPADVLAVEAMTAVVGDVPQVARTALADASFRKLALITAWTDELGRISRQAMADYENSERRAWRETSRPVTAGERRTLDGVLTEHLSARRASGDGWTDIRDLVLLAAPHTDASTKGVRDWAEGRLRALVQEGVLSPEDDRPGEYRVVSVPGQTNSEAATTG